MCVCGGGGGGGRWISELVGGEGAGRGEDVFRVKGVLHVQDSASVYVLQVTDYIYIFILNYHIAIRAAASTSCRCARKHPNTHAGKHASTHTHTHRSAGSSRRSAGS